MRPPRFWELDGILPRILSPASGAVAAITARRLTKPGWRAPVPVICFGNVTLGGTGKTTLAIEIGNRLLRRGIRLHFLLRGYGGSTTGTRWVQPGDDAALVGDEALLLAAVAPTWTGADRAKSARAAAGAGAELLILDDGLQNPGLVKDLSFLVVDGEVGFGNGRVMPAGPLREPARAAAARCQAVIIIGQDLTGATAGLNLPILRIKLVPGPASLALAGERVLAFAGIGRPEKFFHTLAQAGAEVATAISFPDHHRFRAREIDEVLRHAETLRAVPVTTRKDAMRLPPSVREAVRVADVQIAWEDEAKLDQMLSGVLP
ncbi:MAG: tetraacyldisaccharide 4'-kinase [Acetobacteraceae bacterium]|nr:tetraacyldisaccharide 4'-kinase [Acetobacteraceae bacterium]MBV8592417.1 tetraacyldisaccharide 4'-kinase [Acetobacteraceae bacterium]